MFNRYKLRCNLLAHFAGECGKYAILAINKTEHTDFPESYVHNFVVIVKFICIYCSHRRGMFFLRAV